MAFQTVEMIVLIVSWLLLMNVFTAPNTVETQFTESVRGATVFIVQSTNPPADTLFELLLMIDAARRASAYKVIAVMPYFGWARQDRKDRPRVAIGAKLVANLLRAAGADGFLIGETLMREENPGNKLKELMK